MCPDIAVSDIVSSRHDIVSFLPISEPILVISTQTRISGQKRDKPVPCQLETRYYQYLDQYRDFPRYRLRYRVNIGTYLFLAKLDIGFFTDIVPDMVQTQILQKISEHTDIWTKKPRYRSRCVCNIAIYLYRALPLSGVFPEIGDRDDISSAALPAPGPACSTDPEATVQKLQPVQPLRSQLCRPKGQCLGYCLHPYAQRSTAEKGQRVSVARVPTHKLALLKNCGCQHTQNLKLET